MILDERQNRILRFVVRDYVKTAEPVSSVRIRSGLNLKESPATIRNIVASLDSAGFLEQPHTSSGRVPTDKSYRYFVDNLMSEDGFLASNAWRAREKALSQNEGLDRIFARVLNLLSVVSTGESNFTGHGFSNLLKEPEFKNDETLNNLGYIMDHIEEMFDIYRCAARDDKELFIGRENPARRAYECGVFYIKSSGRGSDLTMLLIGPKRMNYEKVSGYIDHFFERR